MTTIPSRRLGAAAALTLTAAALAGCSFLSSPDPVQTYRFGRPAVTAPASTAAKTIGVQRGPAVFTRAASSDRILAVTGSETAYVAGARWIAPAPVLFDEQLSRAFAADPGPVRLLLRGEPGEARAVLHTEVRTFEVRYPYAAEKAKDLPAPTVVVEAAASLSRATDRTIIGERNFTVTRPVATSRVGAIVPEMDAAMQDLVGQLVAWTNTTATAARATAPDVVPPVTTPPVRRLRPR